MSVVSMKLTNQTANFTTLLPETKVNTSNMFFNMNFTTMCMILTVFAFAANAVEDEDAWLELRVTYSEDKTDKWAFNRLPDTRIDAEKAGWRQIGGKDASCSGVGYRYILDNDPAAVAIYDGNGDIVGFQNGVPQSQINSDKLLAWYKQQPMFQVEQADYNKSETLYTLKAYACDPDTICLKGFNCTENFFYLNGTKKMSVPRDASKLDPIWVKGKCNKAKGEHYYYNIRKDMSCDSWQPFFPLYHKGKLVAFSFAYFGEFQLSSKRYGQSKYHPSEQYKIFFDVVPDCLYTFGNNLITLHGYMIDKPWDLTC